MSGKGMESSQDSLRGEQYYQRTKYGTEYLEKTALNLTENYTKTVLCHSGQVMAEKQKQAAIPWVLKLFKDVLKNKMPDFNSDAGFADAHSDPAYNYAMNAYFQDQCGYEFLVECHTREVRDLIQSRASSSVLGGDSGSGVGSRKCEFHSEMLWTAHRKTSSLMRRKSMMSKYVIAHPEYNSYRGFSTMMSSKEFLAKFMELVCRILNDA